MDLWITLLPALLIGAFILVFGILIFREQRQSFQKAVIESLIWSSGFFVAFSLEILLIANS